MKVKEKGQNNLEKFDPGMKIYNRQFVGSNLVAGTICLVTGLYLQFSYGWVHSKWPLIAAIVLFASVFARRLSPSYHEGNIQLKLASKISGERPAYTNPKIRRWAYVGTLAFIGVICLFAGIYDKVSNPEVWSVVFIGWGICCLAISLFFVFKKSPQEKEWDAKKK